MERVLEPHHHSFGGVEHPLQPADPIAETDGLRRLADDFELRYKLSVRAIFADHGLDRVKHPAKRDVYREDVFHPRDDEVFNDPPRVRLLKAQRAKQVTFSDRRQEVIEHRMLCEKVSQ